MINLIKIIFVYNLQTERGKKLKVNQLIRKMALNRK